jgi:hypothetical protein
MRQFKSFAKTGVLWQAVATVMKRVTLTIAAASLLLGAAYLQSNQNQARAAAAPGRDPAPVARIHSIGAGLIGRDTNGLAFQQIWALPESAELRQQTVQRLVRTLERRLAGPERALGEGQAAAWLQPLFTDLLTLESIIEVRTLQNGLPADWTVAVRANPERAALWSTNLWQAAAQLARLRPERAEAGPASWKTALAGGEFLFAPAGDWVVLEGRPRGAEASELLARIRREGRAAAAAPDYWIRVEADLARLPWQWARSAPDAQADLRFFGRGEYVRTEGKLTYAKPHGLKAQPWMVPTNTIRDPLISFTAIQGVRERLAGLEWAKEMQLNPVPDQLFGWGLSPSAPFQLYAAAPVKGAGHFLERVAERMIPRFNAELLKGGVGQLTLLTNQQTSLSWLGWPILVPHVRAAAESSSDFLVAGLFPLETSPFTNPPPVGLIKQLTGRPNIVYYDWEITQPRLEQLRPLLPFLSVVTTIPVLNNTAVSYRWLDVIEPRVGETVTEASISSPRELSLTRRSHLGLTGLELLGLALWLDHPGFPEPLPPLGFRQLPGAAPAPPR